MPEKPKPAKHCGTVPALGQPTSEPDGSAISLISFYVTRAERKIGR
jgi:hypothetical protein